MVRGKDTPSMATNTATMAASTASLPFTHHQPLLGSGGIRANTFQYDVDFNIKSINSSFQSHIASNSATNQ